MTSKAPRRGLVLATLGGLVATWVAASSARASDPVARAALVKQVNTRLLAESRKSQCTFKTDSDVLTPGCDHKLDGLAKTLLQTRKKLSAGAVTDFKFEVTGHPDASGKPEFDRELSARRAATIAREMVARGVSPNEILAFGTAADGPAKVDRANRSRYEIQIR